MRGMSWTTNLTKARWFADRLAILKTPTFVFEVTVPSPAVLATIAGRQENEVVVNPFYLRGRATPRVLGQRPPASR
jgi:hypothetical protein